MRAAGGAAPALLRGIDRAAFVVTFASRLRRAGVAVGLCHVESLTRALDACPPSKRSHLYWCARICLVGRHDDLEVFDAVFAAVFDDAALPLDPHARRRPLAGSPEEEVLVPVAHDATAEQDGGGLPWATLPAATGTSDDPASTLAVPERLPSAIEQLADIPFEQLDSSQLLLLGEWLEAAFASWPKRRSRRQRPAPSGRQVALRPTMTRARRTGFEPVEVVRTRPVRKPRRIVMLCDVSQSMQAYATAYLHLMRVAVLGGDAEVFTFAMSLTRLTPVLAHKSAHLAVDQATSEVADRFGGTRIAASIRELLASRHGNAVRGAVVVVASDGWDSDPPHELGAAMARLHHRAYRVVWINPRAASPGWRPLVGAMSAALPYCDDLFAAHTVRALAAAMAEITARPVASRHGEHRRSGATRSATGGASHTRER